MVRIAWCGLRGADCVVRIAWCGLRCGGKVHALEWLIRRRDDAMAGRVVEGFGSERVLEMSEFSAYLRLLEGVPKVFVNHCYQGANANCSYVTVQS